MWLESEVKIHAPEVGRAWLNSPPLTNRELRGRVVLVDFWEYTCVNCFRALPYLKEWHCHYSEKGLTILGVHTPEFSFAQSAEHVARAVREFGSDYPILLDSDYQIWQAYANGCWPAKYLIDKDGYIRYYHFGEGAYGETEEAIQKLPREINPDIELPSLLEPLRDTDRPGARCYPVTPELYLGFGRGRLGNPSGYALNEVKDYDAPCEIVPDFANLDGPWYTDQESIEACPLEERPSRVLLRYTAMEVNLVMTPPEQGEALVRVMQDGQPVALSDVGEDIHQAGEETVIQVREPRIYRLVRNHKFGSRLLELATSSPSLGAYAFSFVSCAM